MSRSEFGGYATIKRYVREKLKKLLASDRTFSSLYTLMFSERDNVMAERTDGNKIIRTTYGECYDRIEKISPVLGAALENVALGSMVGLYMDNSIEWIQAMWAILKCGYRPLLLNMRLDDGRLYGVLRDYDVKAVVSDGRIFDWRLSLVFSDIAAAADGGENGGADITGRFADELIVMSSGTSPTVKLCGYCGENFAYQISDSVDIITRCKQVKKHFEGKLKLLVFLPLYHIFGLAAVYMWFGFFSRTFVFLKDIRPDTILYTVKKHKVTHIFAVPLFWNKVYDGLYKKLAELGEKTEARFAKGLRIAEKTGSKLFSKLAFGEVRENLFGGSIRFMISGGGAISPKVLGLFNAVGYRLANGYGMSEVGITSVELSGSNKVLGSGSVGKPFAHVEYSVNADGELLVRGRSSASRIWQDGKEITLGDEFYNTRDLVRVEKGRYYILGRMDDMIVDESGENINPDWVESRMSVDGAFEHCLVGRVSDGKVNPVLILRVSKYISAEKLKTVRKNAEAELSRLSLAGLVRSIVFTGEPIMRDDEIKLNRRRIAAALADGTLSLIDASSATPERINDLLCDRVRAAFAEATGKPADEIGDDDHFFFDMGGSSLDYFSFVSAVREEFDVSLPVSDNGGLATVRECCEYIRSNI